MSVSTYGAVGTADARSAAATTPVTASSLGFPAAVLMLLAGMGWGLAMAITQDHAAMPAHAHLNLVGWVCLFLFGLFYHLHPALDRSRLAKVQVVIWIVASIAMTIGVGLVTTGRPAAEPIAAISSMVVFADMVLFGWLVMRRHRFGQAAGQERPAL
jgi:cbb3-type cytochrome oxidase subunit 1